MKICYVSLFLNLDRDKWSRFERTFTRYLDSFRPFINLFTTHQEDKDHEMVLYLDKKHIPEVKKEFKPNTNIKIISIDKKFMKTNFPMWKTLPRERQIMKSKKYEERIGSRIIFPESHIPEYTLVNHCKIDAIAHTIVNNHSEAEYFCWVDFGYFASIDRVTTKFLDLRKLDLHTINYTLINPLTESDKDIERTLKMAPERFGGFFFFGSRVKMMEYQGLYHRVLNYFQNELGVADDDQHLAMICYFNRPELFTLHYLGGWHKALVYFEKC